MGWAFFKKALFKISKIKIQKGTFFFIFENQNSKGTFLQFWNSEFKNAPFLTMLKTKIPKSQFYNFENQNPKRYFFTI